MQPPSIDARRDLPFAVHIDGLAVLRHFMDEIAMFSTGASSFFS